MRVGRRQIVMAIPGGLPLCVLAGDQFRPPRRLGERDVAAQIGGQFRHAVRDIAGSDGSSPSASNARTSSSAPACSIAANRPAIAARSSARAGRPGSRRTATAPVQRPRLPFGERRAGPEPHLVGVGRSAGRCLRPTLRPSRDHLREPLVQRPRDRFGHRPRAVSRAACPGSGMSASPRVNAAKYRPVPPHRIGSLPARTQAPSPFPPSAPARHQAALPASAAGRTPNSRCGTAGLLRRAGPGGQHAQLAIDLHRVGVDDRPAQPLASAIASADLPLQVGPATIRAGGYPFCARPSCPRLRPRAATVRRPAGIRRR